MNYKIAQRTNEDELIVFSYTVYILFEVGVNVKLSINIICCMLLLAEAKEQIDTKS